MTTNNIYSIYPRKIIMFHRLGSWSLTVPLWRPIGINHKWLCMPAWREPVWPSGKASGW